MSGAALHVLLCLVPLATEVDGQSNPFPVGEKLTYKVKFKGISAGTATMRVVRMLRRGMRRPVTS